MVRGSLAFSKELTDDCPLLRAVVLRGRRAAAPSKYRRPIEDHFSMEAVESAGDPTDAILRELQFEFTPEQVDDLKQHFTFAAGTQSFHISRIKFS